MPDITNQLQKTALNQQNAKQEEIKALVAELDKDLDQSDAPEAWTKLKKLILPPEEKKEDKGETEQKGEQEKPEDENGDDDKEETVESLVKKYSKDELEQLANEEKVDIIDCKTKTDIAEAILAKRKGESKDGE